MIQPRRSVVRMRAYQPPPEGRRGFVRMDFNENTYGFPELMLEPFPAELLAVYPEYDAFHARLAAHWRLLPEQLLLTNGSDEALWLIAQTFVEPCETAALIPSPTFPLIKQYLLQADAQLREVPVREDLSYDVDAIREALEVSPRLVILPSPDNPTGAHLTPAQVEALCQVDPPSLIVVDEAYSEYGDFDSLFLIHRFDNLLVTRSFSKAWGLAGLRLGAVCGHPRLIEFLRRVRPPYSVNAAAIWMGEQLLQRADIVRAEARATVQRKQALMVQVRRHGYRVWEGGGNFFLMGAGIDAAPLTAFCRERGVLVRNRSTALFPDGSPLWGMLRVSVGSEAEHQRFLECIEAFRRSRALIFDMDNTLVDTSRSYDAVIMSLVERHLGRSLPLELLMALRAEGGFNDDWDATVELLHRQGVHVQRVTIAAEGTQLYLELASQVETFELEPLVLERLARRYRLLVVTGRTRAEYEPIWGPFMEPLFERVVCVDDEPSARPKPAPDTLKVALDAPELESGFYLGNSVDDMQAALAAGLLPIGVTTTLDSASLVRAGAAGTLSRVAELTRLFMLEL